VCTALALTTAGCAPGPVAVDSPAVPAGQAAACRDLVDALPDRVADQERRAVEPDDGLTAAWGDPALVLRCGVGRPAGFDQVSPCQVVDDVGWFLPESAITGEPTDLVLTVVDRSPRVELFVPEEYYPPAAAMVDLAPAVTGAIEQTRPCL
jgi:hypothetical protein